MRLKKEIISVLVLIMVISGSSPINAKAETKLTRIDNPYSITNPNTVFDTETIEKSWEEVNKNLEIVPDRKGKRLTNKYAILPSLWEDLPTSPTGNYPTRKGVILVTADSWKGIVPLGHAAIVYSESNVVESVSAGVVVGKNNWYSTKDTCYGVSVRGTTASEDKEAANYCYQKIGKKYNYNFYNTNTRDKFYCSQLVWAAFYDLYDIDLNTYEADLVSGPNNNTILRAIHPVEFVGQDLTYTIYAK